MSKQQRFIPELFGALLLIGVISTSITGSDNSDKLGPIESLTIQGEGKELTLTNSDGRLSWGDQKTSTVWSVGFMEVGKALSQLMRAEHFLDARDSLEDELQETMASARSSLDSLREEGSRFNLMTLPFPKCVNGGIEHIQNFSVCKKLRPKQEQDCSQSKWNLRIPKLSRQSTSYQSDCTSTWY